MNLKNRLSRRFENAYHRLIAVEFAGEFVLIYPLYSIMFSERSHISPAGIGFLLGAWQISQILAEVPTGVLADRFSKKYSIIAGKAFKALCYFIWLLVPSFTGYLVGFIIWGIGEAFASGATQAYLYELNDGSRSTSYLKSSSRLQALKMVSYVIAYIFTFIIGTNYPLLLALSSSSVAIAFLLAFSLPASKPIVSSSNRIIREGVASLKKSKPLRRKFIEGLIILSTITTLVEIIVINYRDYGVSPRIVPLVISAVALSNASLFWLLHRYEDKFRKYLTRIAVISVLIYLLLFNFSTWWQVLGLFIASRFMRIAAVVQESDIQDDLDGSTRATVLSFYSLIGKLFSALQLYLIGVLAVGGKITQPTMYLIIGTVLLYVFFKYWFKFSDKRS